MAQGYTQENSGSTSGWQVCQIGTATNKFLFGAALNYLDKFWNNIFACVKNGGYPIDNNIAERSIRPLTTQRNSMLHFGCDEGAEMAATYHSIISTVKMQGRSA